MGTAALQQSSFLSAGAETGLVTLIRGLEQVNLNKMDFGIKCVMRATQIAKRSPWRKPNTLF